MLHHQERKRESDYGLELRGLLTLTPTLLLLPLDSRWLLDNGYEIAHISLVDMFVQTHHIETMVSFKKVV